VSVFFPLRKAVYFGRRFLRIIPPPVQPVLLSRGRVFPLSTDGWEVGMADTTCTYGIDLLHLRILGERLSSTRSVVHTYVAPRRYLLR